MHMQPDNQTPPAPPPITPGGPQDQYNFIMNPGGPAPKKSLLPSDKKKKMLLFVGGGVTLLIVLLMLISILSNRPNDITEQLVTIAKQQNELIRIAEIGTEKARTTDAQNLAVTTRLSLSSQQQNLLGIVGQNGKKLSGKELSESADARNDQLLNDAEQNNRFDEVFKELLETEIAAYQKNLESVFFQTDSKSTKDALSSHYNSASLLAGAKEAPVEE
jgi:hypothetical protein